MKDKTGKFVKPKSVPVASDFADPDFCYGLPGRLSPAGNFDPAGFTAGKDKNTVYRYREAELSHGRIAMLSVVGFLVGEKVEGSTFLFDGQITGPAINHLQQVPRIAFWSFTAFIGYWEYQRALFGWKEPKTAADWWQLNDGYMPGDFNWDPAGVRPKNKKDLEIMQTRELQNGRLAMLGSAGIVAQELTDELGISEHFAYANSAAGEVAKAATDYVF